MGAREWLREQVEGKAINFASTAGNVEGGRIARIFAMRNPDKLDHLEEETRLAR